jgi:hypothetical protein
MEVPQGNSLCSYFKQPKCHFFFFFFSYTKSHRRVEQVLPGWLLPEEEGRRWGNDEGR